MTSERDSKRLISVSVWWKIRREAAKILGIFRGGRERGRELVSSARGLEKIINICTSEL